MTQHNFQVNLRGMIDILSHHLYSEERVFIRELLQNAVDAITMRMIIDKEFKPRIEFEIIEQTEETLPVLIFEDNGIGLTEDEVHKFLSSIGSSSKRDDLFQQREEFIGQFGIGLLSCFMVTDEIAVITQSAKGGQAIEWRGNADGSYKIRLIESKSEPGTKIYLTSKPDQTKFFTAGKIKELIRFYGNLLPFPIKFIDKNKEIQINEGMSPWDKTFATSEQERTYFLEYGQNNFEIKFEDYLKINSKDNKTRGIAFILPYPLNPSAKGANKVYLKNMLISETVDDILPGWAFFVKCIINTDSLHPTASREAFYKDELLLKTREQLGRCIINYLMKLSKNEPERLKKIVATHLVNMKAIAANDEDFFQIIIHYLPFETNDGNFTLPEFEKKSSVIRYISNADEFKQISPIALAQQIPIINAIYVYDVDLIKKYSATFPDKVIEQLNINQFTGFFDELAISERNICFDFIKHAELVLQEFKCSVELRKFKPESAPSLFTQNSAMSLWRSAEMTKQNVNKLWSDIIDNVFDIAKNAASAQLCFNFHNPLVQKLLGMNISNTLTLCIKIIYVQSLLAGHYPLQSREINILNNGLIQLIDLATVNQ